MRTITRKWSSRRGITALPALPALSVLCVSLSSCGLLDIKRQAEEVGAGSTIRGQVEVATTTRGDVMVMLAQLRDAKFEVSRKISLARSGTFKFPVLPGEYFVGAFVDVNHDGTYQNGEPAAYLGMESASAKMIRVEADTINNVDKLVIHGPIDVDTGRLSYKLNKAYDNIGKVVSLEDAMFSHDNASKGFWRVLDYAQEFGGGLMMLQPYEANKTPVIFVHGIFGTALEFKDVIATLDRTRFQPWVMQYPSGAPLDLISDYMIDALNQLQARHHFDKIVIIAHSMGGLVTRAAVMRQQSIGTKYKINAVMTINSPLYGMDSAASGVKNSPIVVPVWRDVASGSEYIKRVHEWRWPAEIPYYLLFSYLPEEEGDGVVPLRSQLSQSLQDEATYIHGFQAQHSQVLQDPEFIRRFNLLIAKMQ